MCESVFLQYEEVDGEPEGTTYRSTVASKEPLEHLGQLRVSERDERGLSSGGDSFLVGGEDLHALAQDHERLVDRPRLLQSIAWSKTRERSGE